MIRRQIKENHIIPRGEEKLHSIYDGMLCDCEPEVFAVCENVFLVRHRALKMVEQQKEWIMNDYEN